MKYAPIFLLLCSLSAPAITGAQTVLNEIDAPASNGAVVGDFNGDGLNDFVQFATLGPVTYIGSGDGFITDRKTSIIVRAESDLDLDYAFPQAEMAADLNRRRKTGCGLCR